MRQISRLRWLVLIALVGLVPLLGRAEVPPPQATASFYGIGDLVGGPTFSTVRGATRVGGTIYAVGGSAARNQGCSPQPECLFADTAVLWTWDGSSALLTPLPDLMANPTVNGVIAAAITPDAAYIASQARDQATGFSRVATRVQRVPLVQDNLNISPYTVFGTPASTAAISASGLVLYGTATVNAVNRAVRFEVGVESALIPLLNASDTNNSPALRGTSSDGSVMVGTSGGGPAGASAFRYVHGSPGAVTAIPRLVGGTFNRAVAVSPDGNLTLVSGNSTFLPNGESYLYDALAATRTPLGSPNTAWSSGNFGGVTSDGSVVVANYVGGGGARAPYLRNSHGWFHLSSALAAAGVDLAAGGWDPSGALAFGVSADGTLVFGHAPHNGNLEGFVAEFPAGFLAGFDVPAVAPADTSIVGAWVDSSNPQNSFIFVFLADGTFFAIEANVSQPGFASGYDRGRYSWNSGTGAFSFTTVQDTNGSAGVTGADGLVGLTAVVSGNTLILSLPATMCQPSPTEPCGFPFDRIAGGPGSLEGSWFGGSPAADNSSMVLVLLGNGDYYFAQDGDSNVNGNGVDGIEKGTWVWNPVTGQFSSWTTVDTNGQWGLNSNLPPNGSLNAAFTLQPSPDGLRATAVFAGVPTSIIRVAVASAATPPGTNISVQPTAPGGAAPMTTIQFSEVTGGGETSLEVIDPAAASSAALPPGFALGDPPVYYEINTTATFTGNVTVCFNYGGITFANGTPRLLHYDENLQDWVDITSSVDSGTSTICGLTSSFSPFAIAASPTTTTGFHPPISPVGSYPNAVKGGSTVPLKFNVHVNGVEKTDPAGLAFSVVQVGCAVDAGEIPVPGITAGGSSLRYAGDSFIINWKTPTTPGCYFVRVTGNGLLLNALFKAK